MNKKKLSANALLCVLFLLTMISSLSLFVYANYERTAHFRLNEEEQILAKIMVEIAQKQKNPEHNEKKEFNFTSGTVTIQDNNYLVTLKNGRKLNFQEMESGRLFEKK